MAHDIFISYSYQDKKIADGICANLENAGLRCWIAPRDIGKGESRPAAITNAISQSRLMVLVFSSYSNMSDDISNEIFLAANARIVIIPFKIEDILPEPGKQYYLGRTHWLDATNPPTQTQINQLVERVKLLVPRAEVSSSGQSETGVGTVVPAVQTAAAPVNKSVIWLRSLIGLFLVLAISAIWLITYFQRSAPPGSLQPTFPQTPTQTLQLAETTFTPSQTTQPATITPTPTSTPTLANGDVIVSPKDGMNLHYVSAGPFLMGTNNALTNGKTNEKPAHEVTLDAFWIDETEVTNRMVQLCVKAGSCQPPGNKSSATRKNYYEDAQFADYPVINVSWNDARAYCEWAGRTLPSEAQWEKAARWKPSSSTGEQPRGEAQTYPWGMESDSKDLLNYNNNVGDTTRVGQYPAGKSPYGVFDMAGNVWEWVYDRYGENYYRDSPAVNPLGPDAGQYRVLRGGSWNNYVSWENGPINFVRSATRNKNNPDYKYINIGFRCALPAS